LKITRALLWMCAAGMSACAASSTPDGSSAGAAPMPAAAPPATLAGTRWMGVIDASLDKRSAPWLEFIREGRLSGFTGCNMLSGGWRMEGGQIRVGPLVTTKRGCLGPEGDIERRVLAAVNEQSRVTRDGARLVFLGSSGGRFEFVEAK
jgi:heat shock protein HslJ